MIIPVKHHIFYYDVFSYIKPEQELEENKTGFSIDKFGKIG